MLDGTSETQDKELAIEQIMKVFVYLAIRTNNEQIEHKNTEARGLDYSCSQDLLLQV